MRQTEVRAALVSHCETCTPEHCTRPYPHPLLERSEWAVCPLALICWPWWRRVVKRFVLAEISPLEGWIEDYPAVVVDAFVAIKMAQNDEVKRLAEKHQQKTPGTPEFGPGPLSGE